MFDLDICKAGSWVSQKVECEDPQVWILSLGEDDVYPPNQMVIFSSMQAEIQKHECISHML